MENTTITLDGLAIQFGPDPAEVHDGIIQVRNRAIGQLDRYERGWVASVRHPNATKNAIVTSEFFPKPESAVKAAVAGSIKHYGPLGQTGGRP